MDHRPGRSSLLLVSLVTLLAAGVVAGCGGGGGGSAGTTASSTVSAGGTATSIIQDAGLTICGDATRQYPPSVTDIPGLQGVRAFFVAQGSCNGAKVTPNWIAAFVFTSADSFDSGAKTIERTLKESEVYATFPLVIASTGPEKEANLEALKPHLPAPSDTDTGTGTTSQ